MPFNVDPHELALIEAWQQGSSQAAEELARRYYPTVRRFFDLRAPGSADDLTQQTFLGALEARGRFRRDSSFKTFLLGIARYQMLRFIRSRQQGPRVQRYATDGGPKTSLSMVAVRMQEHQLVLMALSQLPEELQVIIELYYWETMPTADIGEVLELNASTVTTRLARARQLLRDNVEAMTRPGVLRDRLLGDLDGWARALGPVTAAANAWRPA